MIYLIKGNDSFHIDKKINEIITKTKTNDFDIHRYDGKSRGFSLQELVDDLMTIPFFSGTKVVLYKNPKTIAPIYINIRAIQLNLSIVISFK